jgi:hypothetical protein
MVRVAFQSAIDGTVSDGDQEARMEELIRIKRSDVATVKESKLAAGKVCDYIFAGRSRTA